MTQTPAGWYPSGGMERWWDGNQWSDHTRPIQPTQPQPTMPQPTMPQPTMPQPTMPQPTMPQPTMPQPAYGAPQPGQPVMQPGQPAYYQMPPAQKSHTTRNILIILGVLFLLFVGGCFAVVAVIGNQVDNVVNDDTPGGPNVPLEIEPGEGFEVAGFAYSDGWTLGPDPSGLMAVENLKLTNERDKTDQALVEIKLLVDNEVLATTTCSSSDRIPEAITVTLDCFSGDTMPAEYDEVTINDAF